MPTMTSLAATPATDKGEIFIYVSPKGADSASGSIDDPIATFEGAVKKVRQIDKNKPVTVIFREGTYNFDNTVFMDARDSGTKNAPITYKAYEGETPVFTSALKLDTSKFQFVTDAETLARIPEEGRGKVMKIDLDDYNIGKLGPIGWAQTETTCPLNWVDVYLDGKTQMISQWPNGEMHYGKYVKTVIAGKTGRGVTNGGGVFQAETSRIGRWQTADKDQMLVVGYWGEDYRHEMNKIAKIDEETLEITLMYGTDFGVQCNKTKRWKVKNLLEEMDCPTEWYLDRNDNTLYYYPPYDLKGHEMYVSYQTFPLIEFELLNYVNFEGLKFFGAETGIYMGRDNHHINIVGNEFFGLQKRAIQMTQGNNYKNRIVNGRSRSSIGWKSTTQHNDSTYINVESNDFYDTGFSHISFATGSPYNLKDGHSRIHNNFMERASLITSTSGIYANNSMGLEVTNNSMHNMMFHAYDYGYIRSDTSYNHIWNVTREPYDAGAIYAGRDFIMRDNIIHHNLIHNTNSKGGSSSNGTNAIYADDMLSDTHIYNNIMWDTGAGVHVNGANFCTVLDNTMIDCTRGSLTYSHSGETFNATMLLLVSGGQDWVSFMEDVRDNETRFYEEWPELYEELEYAQKAKANGGVGWLPYKSTVSHNIANLPWSWSERIFDEPTLVAENNTLITSDMEDQFVDYKNNDYRLKSDSELAKSRPNALTELNFDYKDTGVYISETRDHLPLFNEETSPFRKLYPANGATGIDAQQAEFVWENAKGADQYIIRIATDPEMKNIVKEQICHNAYATFDDLQVGNAPYYWTVEAQNYSANYPSSWMSTGVPHLFTTSKYEQLKFDTINYNIEQISEKLANLVEGEVGGGYPAGSKKKLEDALAKARFYASMADGQATQAEVDAVEAELIKVYEEVSLSVYSEERNLHFIFKEDGVNTDSWIKNGGNAEIPADAISYDNSTKTIKMNFPGAATVAAPDMPGIGEINRFKMRITWPEGSTAYVAVKHREQAVSQHNYVGNGYMVVIKQEQVEVQRRGSQSGILSTVNNAYLKNGEWADVAFGIVNTIAGVRYYFELNGTVIYDTVDTVLPVTKPGYLSFYTSTGGVTIELQDNEEYKEMKLTNSTPKEDTEVEEVFETKWQTAETKHVINASGWNANGLMGLRTPVDHAPFTPREDIQVRYAQWEFGSSGKTDIYNFDIILNPADGYQAVTVKNSDKTKNFYNVNSYAAVFKKDKIEVQRFSGGIQQFIAIIPNNGYYTPGERCNIKFGAPNVNGGTRVVLYVNDVALCDVLDPNGLVDDGELVFYDYANQPLEIWPASSGALVLDELYTDYYLTKGKVFNHNMTNVYSFADKKTWKEAQIGVDGVRLLSKDQAGNRERITISFEAPYEYQHVYYWVGKAENGDTNIKLRTKSTYDGEDRIFNIDNRNGEAGWIYLGALQDTNSDLDVELEGSGNGVMLIGGFKMVEATKNDKLLTQLIKVNGDSIILNVGKQTAMINGQHSYLQAAPAVVNGRTLVPIRFISEAFGAKVTWDGATATATVVADGHTLKFTENQTTYYYDGAARTLDQPATIVNNRMMLPIRVISEDLGKQVFWEESGSGLIAITNTAFNKDLIFGGLEAMMTYYTTVK